MKLMLLGIAIILFGIALAISGDGSLGFIGALVGLFVTILGYLKRE